MGPTPSSAQSVDILVSFVPLERSRVMMLNALAANHWNAIG
jgi:hypothetical protein